MSTGSWIQTRELHEFLEYVESGLTAKDAARKVGREVTAIRARLRKKGLYDRYLAALNKPVSKKAIPAGPKQSPAAEAPTRKPSLDDFTPREMLKYLYECGYRIEGREWKLVHIRREEVNLRSVINE